MCLGVPGRILEVKPAEGAGALGPLATVDFQGSRIEVSLAFTPDATVGDWVLVHAGYALTLLAEDEARETWEWLDKTGVVEHIPPEFRTSEAGEGS